MSLPQVTGLLNSFQKQILKWPCKLAPAPLSHSWEQFRQPSYLAGYMFRYAPKDKFTKLSMTANPEVAL